MRISRVHLIVLVVMLAQDLALSTRRCEAQHAPSFERIVIDSDFPAAYQVEVADINGDKKPDIVAVGGGTCAWYENPSWKKRIITGPKQTPGVISSATADLDGDGKAEVAIAYEFEMNEPKKGKLLIASQGKEVDQAWTLTQICEFGSIHRLRWVDFDRDGKPELVVAPIFGALAKPPDFQDPASLVVLHPHGVFRFNGDFRDGRGDFTLISKRPILHAICIFQTDQFTAVLSADNLGVGLTMVGRDGFHAFKPTVTLLSGFAGDPPRRGASEIHLGNLRRDHVSFIATIEPWHGDRVVVTTTDPIMPGAKEPIKPSSRTVIDDTLADGHALWVADVDKDGNDEVFAGHRGEDHRVSMYQFDGKTWNRTILDHNIAAQDLRGGDLNADGVPDVVTVGGSTHNVVWYKFK